MNSTSGQSATHREHEEMVVRKVEGRGLRGGGGGEETKKKQKACKFPLRFHHDTSYITVLPVKKKLTIFYIMAQ